MAPCYLKIKGIISILPRYVNEYQHLLEANLWRISVPIQGESNIFIRLTLQKPEIRSGSMGDLAHKRFSYDSLPSCSVVTNCWELRGPSLIVNANIWTEYFVNFFSPLATNISVPFPFMICVTPGLASVLLSVIL